MIRAHLVWVLVDHWHEYTDWLSVSGAIIMSYTTEKARGSPAALARSRNPTASRCEYRTARGGAAYEHWVTRIRAQIGQGGLAQLTVPAVWLRGDSKNKLCNILWGWYSIWWYNITCVLVNVGSFSRTYVHRAQCSTNILNICFVIYSIKTIQKL